MNFGNIGIGYWSMNGRYIGIGLEKAYQSISVRFILKLILYELLQLVAFPILISLF